MRTDRCVRRNGNEGAGRQAHGRIDRAPAHVVLLVLFLSIVPGCSRNSDAPRVRIGNWTWYVDIAATQEARYRGLAGRSQRADDVGMLFVYPQPKILEFCMRGCAHPVDIAFIDRDLRIVKIHTMSVESDPAGRQLYGSGRPAQYALEVAGGLFIRRGIRVGDRVALLGNIPPPAKAEAGP